MGVVSTEHMTCMECGGRVAPESRAGRMRSYRGETNFEIPAWLEVPTCQTCGRLWMDSAMVKQLGSIFELERRRRRAPVLGVADAAANTRSQRLGIYIGAILAQPGRVATSREWRALLTGSAERGPRPTLSDDSTTQISDAPAHA